jgi:dephospho-CoA kinase
MGNRPLQIGITGGIGSGKSTISKVFKSLGIPVYDSDSRAKWIMNNDQELRAQIQSVFGENSYKDGELNRSYLASQVFNDGEKIEVLNGLVHPRVGQDYAQWVKQHDQAPYLIKEAALLFETGADKSLDKIIVVTAPESLRIQRVLLRDVHRSKQEVKQIIDKQMPEDAKVALANYVIRNEANKPVLPQVLRLHEKFMAYQG